MDINGRKNAYDPLTAEDGFTVSSTLNVRVNLFCSRAIDCPLFVKVSMLPLSVRVDLFCSRAIDCPLFVKVSMLPLNVRVDLFCSRAIDCPLLTCGRAINLSTTNPS